MNIDAAFTPDEVQAPSGKVCIVVDVIRSTSTLQVIYSRNPAKVILTPTVQKAMKFAAQQTVHPMLCGERGGLIPEGFDRGNSPREYANLDLTGRTVVFTSSNGTRAVADVSLAPHVFLGSFLNAGAVVEAALSTATLNGLDITMVCAGREERFAIDDAYCAGFLIAQLISRIPSDQSFELGEGGQAALAIYGYYRDPLKLFQNSGAGKAIMSIGLADDLPYLLQPDLYPIVPTLIQRDQPAGKWGFSLLI
ncbi:MAG TPA: 2-phosphosulfolactate phosphatase [Candidatus Ozemobacteraceae bacterium]|nr:2-phosphosulfolactate phosphatase [Candidatus Ozemobacteraceae bacterium]